MPDLHLRLGRDMLIVDGSLETMLQRADIPSDECAAYLNVLDPELIEDIHRRYLMAGAACISTNTSQATRAQLAQFGLEEQLEEINRAGVVAAREAGAPHILATMGFCWELLALSEPCKQDEKQHYNRCFDHYLEQACALVAAEVDALLIESRTSLDDARCAVRAARTACAAMGSMPLVIASCTFLENGRMASCGSDVARAASVLEEAGADVMGLSCMEPAHLIELMQQLASATTLPLIALPNTDTPTLDANALAHYSITPDEIAFYAEQLHTCGVQFIGSCCGSTPAHTGALYATLGDRDVIARTNS
ncbi:MAG: homocysteine S-methyltransferase family protein [Coriobacteriia bacterium]|nr:homocysteine S-methyltransferase family protein [Coriobacteriia bacterium]